ncbi:MAG TPA: DUF6259 domain-containing protein [Candidatus Hydrogenedentes bacterium]|nr:DUF6259 domain-containing protein [Candidatus Hydrogenedentota bacterium]
MRARIFARAAGAWLLLVGGLAGTGRLAAENLSGNGVVPRVDDRTGRFIISGPGAMSGYASGGESISLWRLERADGSAWEDADAASFTLSCQDDKRLLRWSGIGPGGLVQVQVTIRTGPEAPLRMWLDVSGISGVGLRRIVFPRVGPIVGRARACVPEWMGMIESRGEDDYHPDREREWEYPGILSMPWIAVMGDDGGSVQIFHGKPATRRRIFRFERKDNAISLSVIHDLAGDEVDTFSLEDLPVSIGFYPGGWFGAARVYGATDSAAFWREALRRHASRGPSWTREVAAWVWNRGTSEQVLDPAVDLASRLNLPVGVLWHWWHHCPYDAGFPEYFPPREGETSFREAVQRARAKNVRPLVYMNQRLWCVTTASWQRENAERWAVKGPDGAIHPEVYNVFTKTPCAPMCLGTGFWRNWYAGMAEKAVKDLGVPGIYMDQACASCACWDPDHEHPLGSGSWWVEGFDVLVSDIRQRCGPVDVALAGEGCGEAWLPSLDLMLSLQVSRERYAEKDGWEPVPLFQAVYGGLVPLFGNYASLVEPPYDPLWPSAFAPEHPGMLLDRRFETQFRMEQARAFVWGQQPTMANYRPDLYESRPEAMAFFEQLVRLREALPQFLRDGTMLAPPEFTGDRVTIPVSRLSIYAGREGRVREYSLAVSPVLGAGWRDDRGWPALVVVNITDEARKVRVDARGWGWPLPGPAEVTVRRGTRLPERLSVEGDQPFDLELAPREAVACVWARAEKQVGRTLTSGFRFPAAAGSGATR